MKTKLARRKKILYNENKFCFNKTATRFDPMGSLSGLYKRVKGGELIIIEVKWTEICYNVTNCTKIHLTVA